MTHRLCSLFSVLFTAVLLLAVPPGLRAAGGEDSPLHQGMEAMGKAMRTINNALKADDPSAAKADLLAAIQTMQEHAVAGKAMVPASIEKLAEPEKSKQLDAYRTDLAAAIVTMLDLERAVLAGDWEKARAAFGNMRTARKEGHEKYNPEES